MSLGREHGLVLIGLAGPMDVVNLSLVLGNERRRTISASPVTKDIICYFGVYVATPKELCHVTNSKQVQPGHRCHGGCMVWHTIQAR